jgi:hypothetical protein
MNSSTIGLRTAATIFGVVCIAQLLRLFSRAEVIIAGHAVPLWPSVFAALVTGGLCVWLWRLGGPHLPHDGDRTTTV